VHGVFDSAGTFPPFDTTLDVAPFASAAIDAVIRAQPLQSGFVTRLPIYYPGKIGLAWTTVRVVGVDSSAFIVESTMDRTGGTERYWISRSTQGLLAVYDAADPARSYWFKQSTTKR
jgi:hypothetical protein